MTEYQLSDKYYIPKDGGATREFRMEWASGAACAGTDTESFFDDNWSMQRIAKKICRNCPIREECLKHALENFELHGVWGGTTSKERRRLRNRIRATTRMYELNTTEG